MNTFGRQTAQANPAIFASGSIRRMISAVRILPEGLVEIRLVPNLPFMNLPFVADGHGFDPAVPGLQRLIGCGPVGEQHVCPAACINRVAIGCFQPRFQAARDSVVDDGVQPGEVVFSLDPLGLGPACLQPDLTDAELGEILLVLVVIRIAPVERLATDGQVVPGFGQSFRGKDSDQFRISEGLGKFRIDRSGLAGEHGGDGREDPAEGDELLRKQHGMYRLWDDFAH